MLEDRRSWDLRQKEQKINRDHLLCQENGPQTMWSLQKESSQSSAGLILESMESTELMHTDTHPFLRESSCKGANFG